MTNYQLVALDLDGTALTSDGQISHRLLRAVREARARGVVVTVATARRWIGASPFAEALGVKGPIIIYDGALVRGFPSGEVALAHPLDPNVTQRAAEALVACGMQVVAQSSGVGGERILVNEGAKNTHWMRAYLKNFKDQISYAPLSDFIRVAPETLRLVSFGPEKRLRAALEALGDVSVGRQVLPLGSYGSGELTVFSPEASKGSGLRWLAQRLGVPLEQTLAIGDGVNDLSMLRMAGLGVAMGNAAPEIRAEADAVTATNDQDGVALAIERYILDADDTAVDGVEETA
jgi:Cof subfamily protein (haloacid dehalogenase superfamily)